ncbi:MAG: Queuosine precursor transporter [Paracidovorax wautersii]|uniref:Probable queuosine precursor transporter n=1 Tax=Paracidovorax wautersii TaxID=1177982 RepID=A0A7V8JRS2_9BURK|nr:MAG: Queuosine precursor transporter [Paracidovorax wautersii]
MSATPAPLRLWQPVVAMALVIALSNYLVQFPISAWLTWGAFSYPLVFLVCDLTNRAIGPVAARKVAWAGFAAALVISLAVAPWRIAVASGTAFIVAQVLDIAVFNRLRQASWWKAPLAASAAASVIDTLVFFSIAFAGSAFNWMLLAAGDMLVKLAMAVLLLAPYRFMLGRLQAWRPATTAS